MAHTYELVKSFVDKGRDKLLTGYVKITFADDYVAGGFAIDASDVNPSLSTIFALIPVSGAAEGVVTCTLGWDYDNQKIVAIDHATGTDLADLDALDTVEVMFYYEGA